MNNDEPQNDNNEQAETVELIPLAPLLEDPDPDFDVVIERRGRDFLSRFKRATAHSAPGALNTESGQS